MAIGHRTVSACLMNDQLQALLRPGAPLVFCMQLKPGLPVFAGLAILLGMANIVFWGTAIIAHSDTAIITMLGSAIIALLGIVV